jgi:sulfite reductase alpha subunit-like flavoprotein
LESIRNFISEEREKEWLDDLLVGPPVDLENFLSSGTRYSKIFVEYLPSLRLSLDQLITLLPVIKPRTYTCASSPLVHPNAIHLCGAPSLMHPLPPSSMLSVAACHNYQLSDGEKWYGLCSAYIKVLSLPLLSSISLSSRQTLAIGSTIKILHKKNGFDLPPLTTPVILLGIGSGIAPLRSIIQHRTALATQQNILNNYVKTILLYECNDPEEDFLYYDEICEANRNRSVTTCHVAFSQRNGAYRSIQDLLRNAKIKSMIGDSMDIEGGRIYCSGNKEIVRVVEQSIVQLVMEKDGVTEAQAVELLQGADQIYSSKVYIPGS